MIRAAVVLLLVATVGGGVFLAVRGGEEDPPTYRLRFDNAFGVVDGGDFKVAGVRVGSISQFELTDGWPPKAEVTVAVEDAGVRALREDAECEIRPQSLIGEYFVNCQPGQSSDRIPDGGLVPVEQTRSTIPIDVVQNTLRQPYRARLRVIIMTLGAGLAGRPEDLSAVIRRAHPGLRETSETLRILGRQRRTIERFIQDADTVIAALTRDKRDVRRFVEESQRTAEITASRRRDLARTIDRLPRFLAELEPTMAELGDLAGAQVPVLRNLRQAADDLDRTFTLLEPFSERAEPALESLGELSVVGTETIRESRDEIATLRRLARDTPELSKPLRQFLESIDDRARSTERDVRAAQTAPPPPDKTANARGRGFTGMEALLNYFFWQTLAINGFDQVSHVLRFVGIFDEDCSHYTADPTPRQLRRCTSWLGPYQPGVTDPDPTEGRDSPRPDRQAAPRSDRVTTADQDPPTADDSSPAGGAEAAALDYLLGP